MMINSYYTIPTVFPSTAIQFLQPSTSLFGTSPQLFVNVFVSISPRPSAGLAVSEILSHESTNVVTVAPFFMSSCCTLALFGKFCTVLSFGKLWEMSCQAEQRNSSFALSSLTENHCSFHMPPLAQELFVLRCLCLNVEGSSEVVLDMYDRYMHNMYV